MTEHPCTMKEGFKFEANYGKWGQVETIRWVGINFNVSNKLGCQFLRFDSEREALSSQSYPKRWSKLPLLVSNQLLSSFGWVMGNSSKHTYKLEGLPAPSLRSSNKGGNYCGIQKDPHQMDRPGGTIGQSQTLQCPLKVLFDPLSLAIRMKMEPWWKTGWDEN